ncbi:MAG: DHHW family protein, partial [Oscillospiraceae bacterium]|nr:DHHW family protein [Oscillospiraceae bacterium]
LLFLPVPSSPPIDIYYSPGVGEGLERHVRARLPFSGVFERIRFNLLLLGGQGEHNGIFISETGLMRRIGPADGEIVAANIRTVLDFAGSVSEPFDLPQLPVFVSVLPSSAAILQQNLPPFSNTVNQRQFIVDVYSALSGHVTPISVYETLLGRRQQYIYYRTQDNFTSLGGFYISEQMLTRMLGTPAPTLAAYDLTYPHNDFYGDLYRISPYRGIRPDTLTLFHYNSFQRHYMVTHSAPGEQRVYHTMFPEHLTNFDRPMDVFLGGLSAVTNIHSTAPYHRSLLVFGDETALAYAPFLANHYQLVSIVDLFDPGAALLGIRAENYSQVLFAYGARTFMTMEIPAETLGIIAAAYMTADS